MAAKDDPRIEIKKSREGMNESVSESDSDGKIYLYGNKNGTLSQNKKPICSLFKYIAAQKNDVLYELNFMRFYISQDKNVNCILESIQFDRVIDSGNIMDRRVNRNGICYPNSYRGQSLERLKTILDENDGKSFFYNPQIGFGDEAEDILKEFKSFIEICDSKDSKRSENNHA